MKFKQIAALAANEMVIEVRNSANELVEKFHAEGIREFMRNDCVDGYTGDSKVLGFYIQDNALVVTVA